MAKKRKQPLKIGAIKLTDEQREIVAKGVDSEFFKIITEVIIPQRETQLALTLLHAGQDEKDLLFFKGQLRVCTWFGPFIAGEAEKIDDAVYENDGDEISAEDDHSV